MKTPLTLALVAFMTSTAFAEFKAPLPEFKNEKQLAEWRAENASEATSQGYVVEETAFYTGKPYLASSGGYAFKYRSYIPEVARWSSEDPSGFPDGANQIVFAPCPTSEYDPDGLATQAINSSLATSIIGDKVSEILKGQANYAAAVIATLTGLALTEIQAFEPKYTGEYQWNTSNHTIKTNDNPGQEGLSQGSIKHGDLGIGIDVKFKFYLPDPEQGTNPANNKKEWHYRGEGFWMLNLTGSVGGSWEILRPDTAKLDKWHE